MPALETAARIILTILFIQLISMGEQGDALSNAFSNAGDEFEDLVLVS